jgi:hypothetical protein
MRRILRAASFLSIVLTVDALLFLVFGFVSYLSPESTYATIVDLTGVPKHSLISAMLEHMSIFYLVIGSFCLLAAFMPKPHDIRVALVMVVQHTWIGLKGFGEIGSEWIIGNPWPDVIIHALFVLLYAAAIVWRSRQQPEKIYGESAATSVIGTTDTPSSSTPPLPPP